MALDSPLPDLGEGEVECMDVEEVLRRQVHPSFFDRGEPSSQAFRPTKKDAGCLSTRREAMPPKDAFEAHIDAGFASAGTWGISVGEVLAVELRVVDDSELPSVPPCHAYIDFRGKSDKQTERAAKALKRKAITRGCLYAIPE